MVGTRRNFNFFLEDGFLSETLLLPSLPRTCPPLFLSPFHLTSSLSKEKGGRSRGTRKKRRDGREKKTSSFLKRKVGDGVKEREKETKKIEKEVGRKGRRRAIRARHREARYNALRGSLHFLLPGTPLRTLTNEAAEQAART